MLKQFFFYENQRKFGKAYINTKLERPGFSDKLGNFSLHKNEFVLGKNWDWNGDWKIYHNFSTDINGFEYGNNFDKLKKYDENKSSSVRRRIWVRNCFSED